MVVGNVAQTCRLLLFSSENFNYKNLNFTMVTGVKVWKSWWKSRKEVVWSLFQWKYKASSSPLVYWPVARRCLVKVEVGVLKIKQIVKIADMRLLVKFYDIKMVKSPGWPSIRLPSCGKQQQKKLSPAWHRFKIYEKTQHREQVFNACKSLTGLDWTCWIKLEINL